MEKREAALHFVRARAPPPPAAAGRSQIRRAQAGRGGRTRCHARLHAGSRDSIPNANPLGNSPSDASGLDSSQNYAKSDESTYKLRTATECNF